MADKSSTPARYKPGFVLGCNGTTKDAVDVMATKIPQLHALLTVLSDSEWSWNDDIKTELIHLARGVANEIHEAHEEELHFGAAKLLAQGAGVDAVEGGK